MTPIGAAARGGRRAYFIYGNTAHFTDNALRNGFLCPLLLIQYTKTVP